MRHAGRGGAVDARRPRARRQGPLCRRLQLLRLAADEVAGRRRPPRLAALCRAPGLLLAGRPRLRMGADAARPRPGRRRRGLEPARLGPPHRQDPPRPAAAGRQPPARDRRLRPAGRRRAAVPRGRRAGRDRRGDRQDASRRSRSTGCCSGPTVSTVIIGARNEEQLRQNLGAVGWSLTPEQIARLDAASATTAAYPYFPYRRQEGFARAQPARRLNRAESGGHADFPAWPPLPRRPGSAARGASPCRSPSSAVRRRTPPRAGTRAPPA